jgi:acyl-CoA thioester hydrolase
MRSDRRADGGRWRSGLEFNGVDHVHEVSLRVRYADTDGMGVVYYSNYLVYFEVGRTEYLRDIGYAYADLERQGVFLTVSEAHARYRAPAHYDQTITVRTWVSRLRRTRIDFSYEVVDAAGAVLAEGSTVLGCVNAARRPQALPPRIVEALRPLVLATDAADEEA